MVYIKMEYIFLIFVVISYIGVVCSQSCVDFETCGQCIGNTLGCVWCPDELHSQPRCESKTVLKKFSTKPWCKAPVNPNSEIKIIKDAAFLSSKNAKINSIQFKPQNIKLKARPGERFHFKMSYKPASDYPIDIYYLMDNSYTMKSHKDKLTNQATKIYNALKELSNNVHFGAGSFVEKMALPYADESEHRLNTFINHLSLTDNIANFEKIVKAVEHTGNYDTPEAGFDALMQVMVCKEINWRSEARRIIILSTDSTYHSAGDGKMVGAYKPNNMECHVKNGIYDINASLLYDYPSVSQINKIASEKDITIFFAVLKVVETEYKVLAQKVRGAKTVQLHQDSTVSSDSDLVALITKEYKTLVRDLEIDRGSVPSHLELTFDPPCDKNKKCEVIHEAPVNINVTLHVKSCPLGNKYTDTLKIGPVGLLEKLAIDIEVQCQCDCEKKGKGVLNSTKCSSRGTYQCGVCNCNENSYGKLCQCIGTSTEELDIQKCKANNNDTEVCSGRSICSCGKCIKCWSGYYGDQCQHKLGCVTNEGKVCSNNGICQLSTCQCSPGWNGTDCSCSTDTDQCVGANSEVCSGNGHCECGECVCTRRDSKNEKYTGKYCDSCDTCAEERCKQLEDYVECNFNDKKPICDKKFEVKANRTVLKLNMTEMKAPLWSEANWCKKKLSDDSSILFKYLDGRNSTLILIQDEKEMPPVANIWIPIGSALGSILLIGILTVIAWKILVSIHDAREYRKFYEESKAAGFDVSENPLYMPPAISINNPAYVDH